LPFHRSSNTAIVGTHMALSGAEMITTDRELGGLHDHNRLGVGWPPKLIGSGDDVRLP
jgi:hypothetical protein